MEKSDKCFSWITLRISKFCWCL